MQRTLSLLLVAALSLATSWAQTLRVLPVVSAESGQYDDQVSVTCTFPEGCAGGKYWINGGELRAQTYTDAITLDYSCSLSVAGTDAAGRIITDVVTRDYIITRVTPPGVTTQPKEGERKESFYVTRIQWNHVTRVECDLAPFKEGGARHGEPLVWLTDPDGETISSGDANNLWLDGLNSYKAYIYKDYQQSAPGEYILHIAGSVFVLDGKVYEPELELHYTIGAGISAPTFSPEEGTYKGSVTVSIDYPEDGTAFYRFYKLNGAKAKSYTAPITLTESATIEAYGVDEDFTSTTPTSRAVYTVLAADPAPEILDAPSMVRNGDAVTITAPAGATVKYWYDRHMASAQLYTGPISVSRNCHLSCVAYTDRAVSPAVELDIDGFASTRGDKGELVLLTPAVSETAHLMALSPNGRYAAGYFGSDTSSKGFVWDLESDDVQLVSSLYINQLWDVNDRGEAYGWRARSADIDESTSEDDLLWGIYADGQWREASADELNPRTLPTVPAGYPEVSLLSQNGEWAVLGEGFRYHVTTGEVEPLVSMSDRFQSGNVRPERLSAITDDGTIFGTYDSSLLSPEKGVALVRTTDGRWRSVEDWLHDTMGIADLDDYHLTSVRDVTGDGGTLLFHANRRGYSSDDTFTRGLVLSVDVPVRHLPPTRVKAEQMMGLSTVKLTWAAPLREAEQVTAYTVSRQGTALATVAGDVLSYYDTDVTGGASYTYTVTATYGDGSTSAASSASTVEISMDDHHPVRGLAYRAVGLNDLVLTWEAPLVSLPRLQYFNEESETYAFGTGTYDAEFGIRIPASDLAIYPDQQVRTFSFLPTGPQKGYTLNLYRGVKEGGAQYEAEPFYTQSIDPATLSYGVVNTLPLTTPQNVDRDRDLYVTLLIESNGNDNMLGISYEGFRSGYTDLCRIVGVHPQMVAISQNSSEVTEVVLPLGVGIASEEAYLGNMVDHYEVADTFTLASGTAQTTRTTTTELCERFDEMAEGSHTLSVVPVYLDGVQGDAASVSIDFAVNPAAYISVTPAVSVQDDGTACLTWAAPLDEDRTYIHWGDMKPAPGWPTPMGLDAYLAIAAYPVTMTAPYAGDYEICQVYYCPTSPDASYVITVEDTETNQYALIQPENPVLGEINYLDLPEPVTIDPSTTYSIGVAVIGGEWGRAALAYDSSGKWQNGYSNIVNYGLGNSTLAEFVQADEYPNWLMGFVLRQKDARPLPVEGYAVSIDDARVTTQPITETTWTTPVLAAGDHTAAVDVIYNAATTTSGAAVHFSVSTNGIEAVTTDAAAAQRYDLQGRRIVNDRSGRGLYIIGSKKVSGR